MILSTHGIIGSSIVQFDADAVAFFNRVTTAGGSLSTTEKNAVNTLVTQMKTDGIWTKMKAAYPMVGASAAACAQNLKSSSFTGTFTAGWTFASTGVTPNGTSAYMDIGLNPSISITNNNNHISIYSRTNIDTTGCDLGVSANAPTYIPLNAMYLRATSNFASRAYDYTLSKTLNIANSDSRGFFVTNRTSNVVLNGWKNGSKQGTTTYTNTDDITTVSRNFFLGAMNLGGSAGQFANREYAFSSIGDGLSDTEASDFYDAVQAFQTTLSRQV